MAILHIIYKCIVLIAGTLRCLGGLSEWESVETVTRVFEHEIHKILYYKHI